MMGPTGESQASSISSSSELLRRRWLLLGLIFGAGMLAVVSHEVFRWPMKLPGRHGLELMAILLFVRCASGERYAATLAALGGALVVFVAQHNAGIDATIMLLQGLALDGLYNALAGRVWMIYLLPVVAGLVHTIKPLVKMLYQAGLGIPSGSLVFGLGYPMTTHFVFGLVGGLVGVMAWHGMARVAAGQTTTLNSK
jgi:hypothetical protein